MNNYQDKDNINPFIYYPDVVDLNINKDKIISPFSFYPTEKKENHMTKHGIIKYHPENNTYSMQCDDILLINIENDYWVKEYLEKYVCWFIMNSEAISTPLYVVRDGRRVQRRIAMARIFAFLYGMLDSIDDHKSSPIFIKKHDTVDGIRIQDVSRDNISFAPAKSYLEDNNYAYFKVKNLDYFVRVEQVLKEFVIYGCGSLSYAKGKGIRTNIVASSDIYEREGTKALANILFQLSYQGFEPKGPVRLIDKNIYHNDELNIDYVNYSLNNIYCGSSLKTDDKYAYIFMPKYDVVTTIDKFVYDNHADEIDKVTCWIDASGHVATNINDGPNNNTYMSLHRYVLKLLLRDYGIDDTIIDTISIHHIDENPYNNTVDNLLLCSNLIHSLIHKNRDRLDKNLSIKSNIIEVLTLGYIPKVYLDIPE